MGKLFEDIGGFEVIENKYVKATDSNRKTKEDRHRIYIQTKMRKVVSRKKS